MGKKETLAGISKITNGEPQIQQCGSATHHHLATLRINHRQGTGPIQIQFESVAAKLEPPRLRVVAGGSQDRVVEGKLQDLAGVICRRRRRLSSRFVVSSTT